MALKESWKRILSIFAVEIIVGLIILVPFLLILAGASGFFFEFFKSRFLGISVPPIATPAFHLLPFFIIMMIVSIIASIYLRARVWISIPILMIERRV